MFVNSLKCLSDIYGSWEFPAACFISWCANESGDLNATISKLSRVEGGINWHKDRGKWKDKVLISVSGDLIFFDWQRDGDPGHAGLVDKVENGCVYTIEGNSSNEVKQKNGLLIKRNT